MRMEHGDLSDYMGDAPVDIGHDVSIRVGIDNQGRLDHLFEAHKDKEGHPCLGVVTFVVPGVRVRDGTRALWDVVQAEPLTLSPSILCTSCGKHGYIRDGRWVPA